MTGPDALAVSGLGKSFGGVRVLRDFTLTVPAAPDTSVAILGQNGAGKTTLLNLITRLIPADAGTITVFGQDVLAQPARYLARHGVGRTFQSPRLLLDETCLGNVALGAMSAGRRDGNPAGRAAAALDRVGLAGQAGRITGTLPFGTRKLIELARALVIGPRLLLLDEPAAGLSGAEEHDLAAVLVALRGSGITLLLNEHRMALVTAVARRVVMMDGGAIVFDGDAAQAMASPVVRERYLGTGFAAPAEESGPA